MRNKKAIMLATVYYHLYACKNFNRSKQFNLKRDQKPRLDSFLVILSHKSILEWYLNHNYNKKTVSTFTRDYFSRDYCFEYYNLHEITH